MLRLKGRNRDFEAGPSATAEDSPRVDIGVHPTPMGSDEDRMKILEKYVLGGEREFWTHVDEIGIGVVKPECTDDTNAIVIDDVTSSNVRKPVWEDEDDKIPIDVPRKRKLADIVETIDQQDGKLAPEAYTDRLKKRFDRTTNAAAATSATPKWADLGKKSRRRKMSDSESESDEDADLVNDLSKQTGSYVGADANLPKGILQYKKLRDATDGYRIKATVTSVEFNKQAQVLMVSGYTQRVQIYQIGGKDNPLLQSVTLDGFPIETARFSADGEKVYAGSTMHDYFYNYDLVGGKVMKIPRIRSVGQMSMSKFVVAPAGNLLAFQGLNGNIHLISATTYELIATMKMNGRVNALAFSSNGSALYSHGDEGEVYVWDIRNRVCAHRFYDDGCVKGLTIAASGDDRYLATGSNTGVVNVYEVDAVRNSTAPRPLKAIMNLTTSSKSLRFNATSEILALASDIKDKQIKLFHTRSLTTFENFPSPRDKLKEIQDIDFSLNSGYMCVSSDNGRACLYRLLHYANY